MSWNDDERIGFVCGKERVTEGVRMVPAPKGRPLIALSRSATLTLSDLVTASLNNVKLLTRTFSNGLSGETSCVRGYFLATVRPG
jgi:hypothetical protein